MIIKNYLPTKEYFVFYKEFWEYLGECSEEEATRLLFDIARYGLCGVEPGDYDNRYLNLAFREVKKRIDNQRVRKRKDGEFDNRSQTSAGNAKKRWEAKRRYENEPPPINEAVEKEPVEFDKRFAPFLDDANSMLITSDIDNDIDNDKDNDNYKNLKFYKDGNNN